MHGALCFFKNQDCMPEDEVKGPECQESISGLEKGTEGSQPVNEQYHNQEGRRRRETAGRKLKWSR